MPPDSTIEMRFKITDDGSVVLDKIGGKLKETTGHVEKMSGSLSLIKWDSIVNLGERVFHTTERIYNFAKNVANSTNEIERNAKIAGLSADIYQKMAYAAKMSDVDLESLSRGMKTLAGHMDEVRKGGTQAISLFESIGVSTKDTSGKMKPFDQMLGDLADRFKSMPDGIEKVALATDLFGKSGQGLIPMLNQGRSGLVGFYQEAEKMGIILSEEVIRKGSMADETFKKLDARLEAFKLNLAPLAAAFVGSLDRMLKAVTDFNENKEVQKWWTPVLPKGLGVNLEGIYKALPKIGAKTPTAKGLPEEPPGLGRTENLPELPVYLRQSEEALKAIRKANEDLIDQNYKLSDLYDYQANVLKGTAQMREKEVKALQIMEELGIKTQASAEKEIETIVEKYRTLMGQGFNPEDMEKARVKMEEQLRAVGEKYSKPSGWEGIGEEGGVRWWKNVPKDELTGKVSDMVEKSIEQLQQMQRVATEPTGPKTIMIDYTPVQNANQAVEELRKKLDDINNKVITVTIDQRITGEGIEKIEEGLVTRFENKRSRLGQIIQKNIEGTMYYSNE